MENIEMLSLAFAYLKRKNPQGKFCIEKFTVTGDEAVANVRYGDELREEKFFYQDGVLKE